MCVTPIMPLVFKPSKIELEKIKKQDLPNYDSLKKLAKEQFCDILIEKKDNVKCAPDYNIFKILARRRWINPQYIYGNDIVTVRKNTPVEEVSKKIYDASVRAANITKAKATELAHQFIRKK